MAGVLAMILAGQAAGAYAGEFDRIEGEALARLAASDAAKRTASLSFAQLEALPPALSDSPLAFLVVKTGQGNYARLLVSPALRKPSGGEGAPVPVLVLERFDTFEPGRSGSRLAHGAGVVLFDGFQFDLESGLVVPASQGGDLAFEGRAGSGPALKPVGPSALLTFERPVPPPPAAAGPSPGKAVLPGDFAGRYTLHADGRWAGLLELRVDDERMISGRFRSEPNGTSYPVTGQVTPESPQKATFTIKYPRTEQAYEAYLWTEGKNVLAGSFLMEELTFGFFAVREGVKPPGLP